MELWIPLLNEYGFPVMITLYLLHRIEKKLELLNHSIQGLANHLSQDFTKERAIAKDC